MGTHPIFESDFDCLTDMGDFHILKYTGSQYSGDVKNGRMEGKGGYIFASGTRYVGLLRRQIPRSRYTTHDQWCIDRRYLATWKDDRFCFKINISRWTRIH